MVASSSVTPSFNLSTSVSLNDNAQKAMDIFFGKLKAQKVDDETIFNIAQEMTSMIGMMAVGRVVSAMSDEDVEKWEKIENENYTEGQRLIMIDQFCKTTMDGKGLEDLQNEITIEVIRLMEQEINQASTITKLIMNLPEEKFDLLQQHLASNDFEAAKKIVEG